MPNTARITIDLPLPEGLDTEHDDVIAALDALANVMQVQAEDGLYLGGHEDAELFDEESQSYVDNEFFGHFLNARPDGGWGCSVNLVDLDYDAPGSVQGWIDTGHFSTVEEEAAINGPRHCANCATGSCHHLEV